MTTKNSSGDYAGDISPADAWDILQKNPKAQLVDVRTTAEWNYVGLPDLSSVGREAALVEWQSFPSMRQLLLLVGDVLALARLAQAIALHGLGQDHRGRALVLAGGFEGDPDQERHRGNKNGWKATGLPWKQT